MCDPTAALLGPHLRQQTRSTEALASLTDNDDQRCLGCGNAVEHVLWRLGSSLCHDCRAAGGRLALARQSGNAPRAAAQQPDAQSGLTQRR
jgi:hypothetical protein